MKNGLFIAAILLLLTSCEKAILGDEPTNNPESVFETLWNDFDQHYSLFDVRGTDWDNIYNIYRPQVNATTTQDELWTICSNLIKPLDDGHTFLERYNPAEVFASGSILAYQSFNEYSEDLITTKYLDSRTVLDTERISYGKLRNKDIGYIYIGDEEGENAAKIDQVIQDLKTHKAIIVDIRQNNGGQIDYAQRIAGVFADNEQFVFTSATRNGANHNDFNAPTKYFSKKTGKEQYLKPVIVLTDSATISAGEIFLIYVKSFNHITQIGDTTSGDFSRISSRRFLPNGWTYKYSIAKILLPSGKSLDGIGHIPDVYVKNKDTDILAGNDKVLEKAIDYLRTTYGIE